MLLDGGQLLQVALHAGRELLALGANDLELGLAAGAGAVLTCLESQTVGDTGPFGADQHGDPAGEQGDEEPAHALLG